MGEQQGWKELFLAQAFTQQHMESCSWLGAGLGMVLALGWSHSLFQACGDTCPEVSGRVQSWGSRWLRGGDSPTGMLCPGGAVWLRFAAQRSRD